MESNIEVEVRGPLSEQQYAACKDFLSQHGSSIEKKERILIDYSTLIPGQGLERRDKDIRVRVTNNVAEIIVKLGSWGNQEARKELSITTNDSFDALVQLFAALGYDKGVLCERNSFVAVYRGIEFALVEVPGHSYYFEAEILIDDAIKKDAAHRALADACEELGLSIFSQKEYFDYVKELNKTANKFFDFSTYTEGYFKKTYGLKQ